MILRWYEQTYVGLETVAHIKVVGSLSMMRFGMVSLSRKMSITCRITPDAC
jgi:hypothetical protein